MNKSHRTAFRRLRSSSFDSSDECTALGPRRKFAKPPALPPIETRPEAELQCKGSVILWRAQKTCEVYVFLHEMEKMFEVVTIDNSSDVAKELNRLYVPQLGIESIVKDSHYVAFVRTQRKDLLDRSVLNGCVDYIVDTLDCVQRTVKPSSDEKTMAPLTIMRLQRFDGKSGSCCCACSACSC